MIAVNFTRRGEILFLFLFALSCWQREQRTSNSLQSSDVVKTASKSKYNSNIVFLHISEQSTPVLLDILTIVVPPLSLASLATGLRRHKYAVFLWPNNNNLTYLQSFIFELNLFYTNSVTGICWHQKITIIKWNNFMWLELVLQILKKRDSQLRLYKGELEDWKVAFWLFLPQTAFIILLFMLCLYSRMNTRCNARGTVLRRYINEADSLRAMSGFCAASNGM